MIKKLAILLLALTMSLGAFSQNQTDSIDVKTGFWSGASFSVNGNRLTRAETENIIKSNAEAYSYFKKAKTTNVFASIIAGIGGYCIGYPIGYAIAGGEPKWILAGIGAGLIVADIPLMLNTNKKFKKAIDTYNAGVSPVSKNFNYDLNIEAKNGGLALVIHF